MPTVGGEVVFDDCYRDNPLVNVLCLGMLPVDRLVLARAEGAGQPRGAARLGRPGATASAARACSRRPASTRATRRKRPSVQVGDPFEEKRLIEACLELLDAGLAVGVQDLGAAGLSCAASETAAKAGAGMDVDLARVPKREPGMNAVEVMTSESQERMLAIVEPDEPRRGARAVPALGDPGHGRRPGHRHRALPRLRRPVRRARRPRREPVAADRRRAARGVVRHAPVADVPVGSLGDGPLYHRPASRRRRAGRAAADDPAPRLRAEFPAGADLSGELLALLATPTIADKTWVSRQYDHQLFLNTVVGPGARRRGAPGEGHVRSARAHRPTARRRFCRARSRAPVPGSSCSRRRATSRAPARVPIALVNCLNFGNPEHPEVMWQFAEVVDGMSEACEALGIPVDRRQRQLLQRVERRRHRSDAGGRRARSDRRARRRAAAGRGADGDTHPRARRDRAELGGSEWARRPRARRRDPPVADLDAAAALHDFVRDLVTRRTVVDGVHDVSDGGLAVALTEMAIAGRCGFRVAFARSELVPAAGLVLGVGVPGRPRRRARWCRRPRRAGPGPTSPRP